MAQPSAPLFQNLSSPYKEFYEFHGVQLIGVNFPPSVELLMQLYDKLASQNYDSGSYFKILENEEKGTFQVQVLNSSLQKNDKIFIIDHAISFRYPDLRKLLASNDKLTLRLLNMLNFWENKQEQKDKLPNPSYDFVQEFENLEIKDPTSVDIKEDCITLSFYSNQIENLEDITKILKKLTKIKALWLNDNPIEQNEELIATIEKDFPNIEILNSKFTSNAGEWAFKFATFSGDFSKIDSTEINDMRFLNFKNRNVFAINDASAFEKIKNARRINLLGHELPDLTTTNKFFNLLKSLPKLRELICESSVEEILFDVYEQGKLAEINDNLKVVNGFSLSYGRPTPHQKNIERIVSNIWRITNTYRLSSSTKLDETSIWYVMDELGAAIEHDDDPNVCVVPFLFAPHNKLDDDMISFSIMWPIKDLTAGDFISRDYLNGMDESKFRKERSFCWFNHPIEEYLEIYNIHSKKLKIATAYKRKIAEEFMEVKKTEKKRTELQPNGVSEKRPLGVATDMEYVIENLKREEFKIVQSLEEATILFLNENIKENFSMIMKTHFINQFPYESCIVMKHNLASTVFQGLGRVKWIQETFDLETQLKEFLGCYFENERKCKNNLWIIKPPNLARSMDMVVTDNIDAIIRLLETGPRLAQKYIHKPLTLRGNKIDLRYIVLVRGINPLEVFLYKTFWIRTSNNKYSIDKRSLEIYETHFTVMNYGHQLTQIHYYDFIKEFDQENKGRCEWSSVHEKIKILVRELFVSVALTYPQMATDNARAVYGMDVMVDGRDYQPKLLEMTFSPDCQRACKYDPTFYDDVFACLFLHKDDTRVERII